MDKHINHFYTNKFFRGFVMALLAIMFYLVISAHYNIAIQFLIGYGSIIFMFVVLHLKKIGKLNAFTELFLKLLGLTVVLRYMYWRTFFSLQYEGFLDYTGSLLLYGAEFFAVGIYLFGIFTSLAVLHRKPIDLADYEEHEYPYVSIFVPTYNEPDDMIETTLLAALAIDYPHNKYEVCLLDDGGTDQKCNDSNPKKAKDAQDRRKNLSAFCNRVGAKYITRAKNEHAKAGNLNNALNLTTGDLILILDTDHIPAQQFLRRTVGWFLKEPKMFLVQTPHSFYNADPIEKNLRMTGISIAENDMFYKYIQKGHDFWESSFFCGSAAVLRRKYLDELGGIAGETITEDAETAIKLHDKGYKSAYIDESMVRGLQAESFDALVLQRVRWTQGMVQIFILKNPFLSRQLKWYQKLSYTSASFFWFFAYSRVVFFIAPLCYLFFGMKIYNANGSELLAYVVPHMVMAVSMAYFLYGKVRNPFFSELYETALSFFTLPAIISTIRNPRNPTFEVTPKGEELTKDFVSDLAIIFVVVLTFLVLGLFAAIWRIFYDSANYDVIIMTSLWNIFNIALIIAALGITSEKRELRKAIRMPLNQDVQVSVGQKYFDGIIEDISENGVRIYFEAKFSLEKIFKDSADDIIISLDDINGEKFEIKSTFLRSFKQGRANVFTFNESKEDMALRQKLVLLIYGNSTNWKTYEDNKPIMSPLVSLFFIMKQSVRNIMFKESLLFTFNYFKEKITPKGLR